VFFNLMSRDSLDQAPLCTENNIVTTPRNLSCHRCRVARTTSRDAELSAVPPIARYTMVHVPPLPLLLTMPLLLW
jgi:hypothetical protein